VQPSFKRYRSSQRSGSTHLLAEAASSRTAHGYVPIPKTGSGRPTATSSKPTSRPAMTSGLPVISELSSGCFQVKSAPQFSRSGYHDLDAQKIQALAVKKRVKGVLHSYCVTGNSRWRLAVESSPAKRHTPTLHDPLLLPRTGGLRSSFPRGVVRSSCDSSTLANAESS
jgi:hypothetical protein